MWSFHVFFFNCQRVTKRMAGFMVMKVMKIWQMVNILSAFLLQVFCQILSITFMYFFWHSGSDAEFSDVNPIGQTDDHNITHVVVEVSIVFKYCWTFRSSFSWLASICNIILHSVEIAVLFNLFFYETALLFRLSCNFFFDVATLTSLYLPLCDLYRSYKFSSL